MEKTGAKEIWILGLIIAWCGYLAWGNWDGNCIGAKLSEENVIQGAAMGEWSKNIREGFNTDPYTIEEFEVIYQLPQLPTGCEVTSLAMVLNYYGYDVSKTTLASDYLPKTSYRVTYRNGKAYGPDLDEVFVGNPFGDGTICGPGAIATAANACFADMAENASEELAAIDITGTTAAGLYLRVSNGQPVIIFTTISMADRKSTLGWYTEDGDYVDWSDNDHGSVLIGWDEETVTVACPLSGIVTYSRAQFEKVYAERGCKVVVIDAK